MTIEAAVQSQGRRRLFPAWVSGGWNKLGPLLVFYALMVPLANLRSYADDHGFPIRQDFNAVENVLLTAAPNRLFQALLLDVEPLQYLATAVYFSWMFLPLTAAIPLLLNRRPHQYWHLVAFMLLIQISATPLFYLYPLEPPWLQDPEISRVQSLVFNGLASRDNNLYAAMPSLHVGLPFAIALWYGLHDRYGKLLAGYAGLIGVVIVYTGDHYIADIAGGLALAGGVYTLARVLRLPILPQLHARDVHAIGAPQLLLAGERSRREAA